MLDFSTLEPQSVIHFFLEISKIPRESGNEQQISDYLVSFAKERHLEVIQDSYLNILIRKPATKGLEDRPGVILQGHMDMVCDKNSDIKHDFTKDAIDVIIDGDHLTANGTTLGADNGIAVAMGLALLDADNLAHPAIELLVTTDEEVGMTGAINFDVKQFKGKYFLNLDSEDEGQIYVSCAGGMRTAISLPIQREYIKSKDFVCKEVLIKHLMGGHSGCDIEKGRANANKLTGRILCKLDEKIDMHIIDIFGGVKDNVIPREALFTVIFPEIEEPIFNKVLDEVAAEISSEYRTSDPNIEIVSETLEVEDETEVIVEEVLEKIIFLLMTLPNGVQTMSAELEGFVESSLSMGRLFIEDDHVNFVFAIRSSVNTLKHHIADQLELFASHCNAEFKRNSEYPEWAFKKDSRLLEKAIEVYEDLTGEKPEVKSIHAGLEPGVFLVKRPDIEAISLGPNMDAVHSPDEWVSISSIERTWKYFTKLLAELD